MAEWLEKNFVELLLWDILYDPFPDHLNIAGKPRYSWNTITLSNQPPSNPPRFTSNQKAERDQKAENTLFW